MCSHTKIAALRATQSFFPCAGACTYNITLNQLQNQISSLHSWMNQSNSSLAIWYNSEQSTPQGATPDIFLDFGFYFSMTLCFPQISLTLHEKQPIIFQNQKPLVAASASVAKGINIWLWKISCIGLRKTSSEKLCFIENTY